MSGPLHDLDEAAKYFVTDLLELKEAQRLLVYTDAKSDEDLCGAILSAADETGAVAQRYRLDEAASNEDLIAGLDETIQQGDFDVVCELSERYFYPTTAWRRAAENGIRIYAVGGGTGLGFIRCIANCGPGLMYEFGMMLKARLNSARHGLVISGDGAELTFKLCPRTFVERILTKLGVYSRTHIFDPSGTFRNGAQTTFMGGQLAIVPSFETVNGTLEINGCFLPPDAVGALEQPILLEIVKGQVCRIFGDVEKSATLAAWLGGSSQRIEHLCFGFNPNACSLNSVMEAERIFGALSVGIGDYPFHTDGVTLKPELILDGKPFLKNGLFVDESLLQLQEKLLRQRV
jgi:hypothetical protein